jgi:hypothetical protein
MNNDAENAPMPSINRKLGHQPESGYYGLVSHLNGGEEARL